MNKHSIITGVAIAVIVIPFLFSGMSILGAQQLEYRWHQPGIFSFFAMSNSGDMEFCNTIPFWVNLQEFQIETFYDGKHLGTFTSNPNSINPFSSTVKEGIFTSEHIQESQHHFMTLDFEFDGGDIRLDPNKFIVVVQAETPIIGIIPYSTTNQFNGFEFDQMMNKDNLSCD